MGATMEETLTAQVFVQDKERRTNTLASSFLPPFILLTRPSIGRPSWKSECKGAWEMQSLGVRNRYRAEQVKTPLYLPPPSSPDSVRDTYIQHINQKTAT